MDKDLELWAHVVLETNLEGATITLPSGDEAMIALEDDCLIAYTYEGDEDERVVHQRIQLRVLPPGD